MTTQVDGLVDCVVDGIVDVKRTSGGLSGRARLERLPGNWTNRLKDCDISRGEGKTRYARRQEPLSFR